MRWGSAMATGWARGMALAQLPGARSWAFRDAEASAKGMSAGPASETATGSVMGWATVTGSATATGSVMVTG
jgi:hypothetical protein